MFIPLIIGRLAAEGVTFTAAVAGYPLCCPFRGPLLSGRYPHQAVPGHEYQLSPDNPPSLNPSKKQAIVPAILASGVLMVSKNVQGGPRCTSFPLKDGVVLMIGWAMKIIIANGIVGSTAGRGPRPFINCLPTYETDALTDLFIDYLKERSQEASQGEGQPFFVALSVQPPPDPYTAPAEWMA